MRCGSVYLLHVLLILLALTKHCIGFLELKNPASRIKRQSIVHPIVHHGRTKRELSSTRDTNGAHHIEVEVTIPVGGSQWALELRLNEDLVAGDHTLQYQEGGRTVQRKPKKEELDLCHYSGSVRGKPQSWVAVSTCHGVRGVIFDGQRMIDIEPARGRYQVAVDDDSSICHARGLEIQSPHYLYEHNDLNTDYHKYPGDLYRSVADTESKNDLYVSTQRPLASRYKRATENKHVQEPYAANNLTRYVELVLIADHSVFLATNSVQAVHTDMIQTANVVNSIYSPVNIFIALVGVVVWSERDEMQIDKSIYKTIDDLKMYRKTKLLIDIPNDSSHLITRRLFKEGVCGLGYIDTMCSSETSCGVSVIAPDCSPLHVVIAHEMGHNLGLNHDEKDCTCPSSCVMGSGSVQWSSCSLKSFEHSLKNGKYGCVHNIPTRLFNSPTCGNGFVEPGEECDCGLMAGGKTDPCHTCCHPDTCIVHKNATCAEMLLPDATSRQKNFMIKMYVIFLGIIPSIIILLFLIYYFQRNALFWKQPKEQYAKYIGCCTKNYSTNVYKKETVNNVTGKSTLAAQSKLNKPVKNITKDDIQVVTYDVELNTVEPVLNINTDGIQIPINYVKLKPVKLLPKTVNDDAQIATNEAKSKLVNTMLRIGKNGIQMPINDVKLKPVNTMLKVGKDDIQTPINVVKLKPVNTISKVNKDKCQIPINDVKLKPVNAILKVGKDSIQGPPNNVKLKPVNTMLKGGKDDIQTPINVVKLKPVNTISKVDKDKCQIPINDVKLKPVNTILKVGKDSIQGPPNNVKLKPVNTMLKGGKNGIQIPINDIKLKLVEPQPKTVNDDTQMKSHDAKLKPIKLLSNFDKNNIQKATYNIKLKAVKPMTGENNMQTSIYDVKLKPVKPSIDKKPKPPIKPKPEYLNLKPI